MRPWHCFSGHALAWLHAPSDFSAAWDAGLELSVTGVLQSASTAGSCSQRGPVEGWLAWQWLSFSWGDPTCCSPQARIQTSHKDPAWAPGVFCLATACPSAAQATGWAQPLLSEENSGGPRPEAPATPALPAAAPPSHPLPRDCRGGTDRCPAYSSCQKAHSLHQPQQPFAPEVAWSVVIGWQEQPAPAPGYPEVHLTQKAHPPCTLGAAILFHPPFYGRGSHFVNVIQLCDWLTAIS